VLLRPVRGEDAAARQRMGWHADIERAYGHETASGPMSREEAAQWLDAVRSAEADASRRHWVIDVDGRLIGVASLHSIRADDRKARFAIGLFDPSDLGQGYGSDATRLVLRYAFTELGLNRVDLRVLAFNARAIAAYERCGFVVEGRERESCRIGGHFYDDIIMGCLASEFLAGEPA
jgi:RimJ/RimL family protein N-acetyltransferase